MVVVFMVAEKPSLAASIANILSNKNCNTKKGFNGACNVHGKKKDLHCQTWLDFFKIRVVKKNSQTSTDQIVIRCIFFRMVRVF